MKCGYIFLSGYPENLGSLFFRHVIIIYQATRRHAQEDSNLQNHHRDNLESRLILVCCSNKTAPWTLSRLKPDRPIQMMGCSSDYAQTHAFPSCDPADTSTIPITTPTDQPYVFFNFHLLFKYETLELRLKDKQH
jgi:hypothetical protein